MADVQWIKLSTGLPDHRKIKRIRKLPDGDKVILFWVFLLARAGESNRAGGLYLTETLPYTAEDLAVDFDFTLEMTQFAIITLEKYEMITRYDDIIFIKNWEEYQAIDSLEKVREQGRLRQQRYRDKQKRLSNSNVTRNAEVTPSNGTEEELDKEYILSGKTDQTSSKKDTHVYSDIIDYLNERVGTSYRHTTKSTRARINARLQEGFTLQDFKQVIDNKASEWLSDGNMRKYLRPETLFGNKFESYLNQQNKAPDRQERPANKPEYVEVPEEFRT